MVVRGSRLFLKFGVLTPMKSGTAEKTIEILKNFVFFRHSVPEIMLLDSGSQFRSKLFRNFAETFNVTLWKSAFYHPQANPTEAVNSTVVNAIRAYIKDELHHREWNTHLPQIECAMNAAPLQRLPFGHRWDYRRRYCKAPALPAR